MKLQTLLACERIIEDPSGGPSLISVFTKISASVSGEEPIPSNAVIPKDWVIYSVWRLEEQENNKAYTLRSNLYWPDGSQFASSIIPSLPEKADNFLTFTGKANGFPIGQTGKMRISVWVESDGIRVSEQEETYVIVGRLPPQTNS